MLILRLRKIYFVCIFLLMKLLTTQEAAEKLGVSDARIRQLILGGKLPAQKFGQRSILINEDDLGSVTIYGKAGRPPKPKSEETKVKASKKASDTKKSK
jgi:excisionase family DNA binding protein